jgi:tetratricopeptide (TPR) repeat protein
MDRRVVPVCLFLSFAGGPAGGLFGQDFSGVADQYVRWAEEAIAAGRWNEALAGLERGADYADVSSDLSYFLALARSHTGKPLGAVLEALRRAGEAGRWNRCSPEQALLLEAETLIALRNFSSALNILRRVPDTADAAVLRLRALRRLPEIHEFRRVMKEALEQYPRDPRPAAIFLDYARGEIPAENDPALLDLVLGRLPYLVEAEPRLAFWAAPFIKDRDEARRLLGAYRGVHQAPPQSIPAALILGLVDETDAVEEFFGGGGTDQVFDRDLIRELFGLLRNEAARRFFRERLFRFSGLITADDDQDGFPESRVRYREGTPEEYTWDADQDGLAEQRVFFDAGGSPQWAEQVVLPEAAETFAIPVRDEDRIKILILWERYPGVLRSELEGITYIPVPGEFLFRPVRLGFLAEDGAGPGLPFPLHEPLDGRISRRTLASFALTIQRPSTEFAGAVEWIDLRRGVPLRAAEILEGRPVSVTEFSQGKPVSQRVDLDGDGRMETVRYFKVEDAASAGEEIPGLEKILDFSESDWDGDGIFETGEQYLSDGKVVYSWDMDGDGVREYSEIRNRE